jgi:hypothetical protein
MSNNGTLFRVICRGNNDNPIHWDCVSLAQAERVRDMLRDRGIVNPIEIVPSCPIVYPASVLAT